MRRVTAFSVLLAMSLVLSGCLSDSSDEGPEEATLPPALSDEDASDPVDAAPEPAADPDRAPVPQLAADLTTGFAPLAVTFTFDASDADGDALSWTFDADDDGSPETAGEGSGLPGALDFTYAVPGDFTARLSVSDGASSVEATLLVAVTEAPVIPLPDPLVFNGTVTGAWAGLGGAGGPEYVGTGDPSHTFDFTHAIGAVHNFTVQLVTTSEGSLDLDFEVYAPDGTQVIRQANLNDPVDDPAGVTFAANEEPVTVDDAALLALPGEWTLTVRPGAAVEGAYTLTVTFA